MSQKRAKSNWRVKLEKVVGPSLVGYCVLSGALFPPIGALCLHLLHNARTAFVEECGLGDNNSPAECEKRWLKVLSR